MTRIRAVSAELLGEANQCTLPGVSAVSQVASANSALLSYIPQHWLNHLNPPGPTFLSPSRIGRLSLEFASKRVSASHLGHSFGPPSRHLPPVLLAKRAHPLACRATRRQRRTAAARMQASTASLPRTLAPSTASSPLPVAPLKGAAELPGLVTHCFSGNYAPPAIPLLLGKLRSACHTPPLPGSAAPRPPPPVMDTCSAAACAGGGGRDRRPRGLDAGIVVPTSFVRSSPTNHEPQQAEARARVFASEPPVSYRHRWGAVSDRPARRKDMARVGTEHAVSGAINGAHTSPVPFRHSPS